MIDKSKIQTGDIIVTKNKHMLSCLIRKITGSKWSHAEVIARWENTIYESVGAVGWGVRGIDLDRYLKNREFIILRNKKWDKIPMTEKDETEILRIINSKKGVKYDFWSLLYYQLIFQISKKWIGRTRRDAENRFYCSEFAAYVNKFLAWWSYSPDDLVKSKFLYQIFV